MATKLRAIAENTELDEIKVALDKHRTGLYWAMATQTVVVVGAIVITGVLTCGIPLSGLIKWTH